MSTLTYSAGSNLATPDTNTAAPARNGFWKRAFEALMAGQQRRAEREIARYLASHGGMMTDDIEREIMRRMTGDGRAR